MGNRTSRSKEQQHTESAEPTPDVIEIKMHGGPQVYVKMHVLFLARVRSRARSRLMSWYTQHRAVLANAAMSYQLSGKKTDLDWDDVLVDLSWFVEEDTTFWKPDKVYEKMEFHFGVLVKVNHTMRSYTFPTASGSDKLAHARACAFSRLLSWYTQNRAALAKAATIYRLRRVTTDLDLDDVLVDLSCFVEEDTVLWKADKVYKKMELHFGHIVQPCHTFRSYVYPSAAGSDK